MPYKTCRHIMEHGQFCSRLRLSKRDYCYFHIEFRARRLKMARARAIKRQWWLDLPCHRRHALLPGRGGASLEGMAAKVIEPEREPRRCSPALRLSASNFKAREAWGPPSAIPGESERCPFVGISGFEAVHNLPARPRSGRSPLTAFPIPESPEPLPLAETEAPNLNSGTAADVPLAPLVGSSWSKTIWGGEASAEDMELMDIAKHEARIHAASRCPSSAQPPPRRTPAATRRYAELARKHNIQLAAEKIVAEQSAPRPPKRRRTSLKTKRRPKLAPALHRPRTEDRRRPSPHGRANGCPQAFPAQPGALRLPRRPQPLP